MSHYLSTLPDLGKSFKLLKISMELESIPDTSLFAHCVLEGVRQRRLVETIRTIQAEAKENYERMETIIGRDLLRDIIEY